MKKTPPLYRQLKEARGGQLMSAMADQFGLTERDAMAAVSTIMPQLTEALGRNISTDQGLTALLKALANGNHAKYLDTPDLFGDGTAKEDGNAILGHLLGSKRESRALAARASVSSGIAELIVRQILPYLASLLMAWLSKQGQVGGSGRTGGGGGLGRSYPSAGQSQDLSDVLEDLSNITQRKTGGTPSAAPDRGPDRNPYRDMSDVLSEEGPGNKTIAGKIRDTLGSAIGSGGKGIIGWILSAIVWRYGWRVVRYFLKRIF